MKNDTGDLNHLLDNYDEIVTRDDWGVSPEKKEQKTPSTATLKEKDEDEIDIVEEELRNSSNMAKEIMKVSISTKSPLATESDSAGSDSNKMFIDLFSNSSKMDGLNDNETD